MLYCYITSDSLEKSDIAIMYLEITLAFNLNHLYIHLILILKNFHKVMYSVDDKIIH